jgi:heat shock protein HslJ
MGPAMKNPFAVILFLLIFTSSCYKDSLVLNGYEWELISVYQNKVPDLAMATLLVNEKEGTFEGYSGCNAFSGDCLISGETIYFNTISITYKYCGEISDQEAQLIKALKETEKYQVDAGRLLLLKGNEIIATWH